MLLQAMSLISLQSASQGQISPMRGDDTILRTYVLNIRQYESVYEDENRPPFQVLVNYDYFSACVYAHLCIVYTPDIATFIMSNNKSGQNSGNH